MFMFNLNMIIAYDKNYCIGKDNDLIYHFKKDLKRFKELTSGKTIVMGRKTWESLPFKLPNRKNVVLTSESNIEGADETMNNLSDILELSKNEEVWVIGGANVYKQLISYVNRLEVTLIDSGEVIPDSTGVEWMESELERFKLVDSLDDKDLCKKHQEEIKLSYLTYETLV